MGGNAITGSSFTLSNAVYATELESASVGI